MNTNLNNRTNNAQKIQKPMRKKRTIVSEKSNLEKVWNDKDFSDWNTRYPHITLLGRASLDARGNNLFIIIYINII